MKVICKSNNIFSFSDKSLVNRLKKYISYPEGEIDLRVGREYTVYGVVFWDNSPWYYLCSDETDEYPKPFAAEFFEVSDPRMSKLWELAARTCDDGSIISCLVFHEWAINELFYESLIDGEADAEKIFQHYKELMNNEF